MPMMIPLLISFLRRHQQSYPRLKVFSLAGDEKTSSFVEAEVAPAIKKPEIQDPATAAAD
jgi:hypothetical protein